MENNSAAVGNGEESEKKREADAAAGAGVSEEATKRYSHAKSYPNSSSTPTSLLSRTTTGIEDKLVAEGKVAAAYAETVKQRQVKDAGTT